MTSEKSGHVAERKFALDTSCVIALCQTWHVAHSRAVNALRQRSLSRQRLVLPVHVLLESFSVLTRMPEPERLSPSQAEELLTTNFASAEIAQLSPHTGWHAIRELARRNIGGGTLYDAIIAMAALDAGAGVLITLNVKDFLRVSPAGIEIVEP